MVMRPDKTFVLLVALFSLILLFGCIDTTPKGKLEPTAKATIELPKFSSCAAIAAEFNKSKDKRYGYYEKGISILPMMTATATEDSGASGGAKPAYSTTNVQVEGVDEADIVKTDGEYIYHVSGNEFHIAKAYPVADAKLLSSTDLDGLMPLEMFIEGNTVLIFSYASYDYYEKNAKSKPSYYYQSSGTVIQLWDVSDKANPKIVRTVDFEGDYVSSRKIGSTAYFVIRKSEYGIPADPEEIVPLYKEESASVKMEGYEPIAKCGDVSYLPPVMAKSFVTVGSLSMNDLNAPLTKEVIVASGENIYASLDNLYVAEVDYGGEWNQWSGEPYDLYKYSEKTVVHKFALSGQNISYLGYMAAPGHILNQFSMDEYNSYFRIATTKGEVSRWTQSEPATNNVYTFTDNLTSAGRLEDLAPGEKIYSARFMGDRAYLVTFKKVDPLFVIDLSNPAKPKVLGKLKIPGYSDYLHPIDKDHIIGVGKETVEAEEGDFAWYQGIKMAVFDVSDVEHPKEMHKVVIGDRGTDSYALQDHKAFLYDKDKNLLVIPVLLAKIDKQKYEGKMPANTYGDYVFQGAYVFNLTLENGFKLKGTVTHVEDSETFDKSGYYYYGSYDLVKRALYIDDVLYTISDVKILANALSDLKELAEIRMVNKTTTEDDFGVIYQ